MSNSTETLALYEGAIVPNIRITYLLDRNQLRRATEMLPNLHLEYLLIRTHELDFGGPRDVFLGLHYQTAISAILGVKTLPAPKGYWPYDDDRLWWNESIGRYLDQRADWATYAKESKVYSIPGRFVAQRAIFMALEQPGDRNETLETLRAEYGVELVEAVIAYRDRFCHCG